MTGFFSYPRYPFISYHIFISYLHTSYILYIQYSTCILPEPHISPIFLSRNRLIFFTHKISSTFTYWIKRSLPSSPLKQDLYLANQFQHFMFTLYIPLFKKQTNPLTKFISMLLYAATNLSRYKHHHSSNKLMILTQF